MARKTKEEAEKTRILILETALRVFYENGYSGSTLVDIAKQIDLTKGAIYWHFKSKVDLFLELGKSMEEKIEGDLAEIYPNSGNLEDLKEFTISFVKLITDDPQLNMYYSLVYYRMEWHDDLLPVKQFFIKQDEELSLYLATIFKQIQDNGDIPRELDVQSVTAVYQAIVDGFLSRVLMNTANPRQLIQDLDFGITTFFTGLKL